MPSQIALVGADLSGRQALLRELAPRLQATPFVPQLVEELAELQSPTLVLLLAADDAHAEEEDLRWRERLVTAGVAFSVLHGDAQARLEGAWQLIAPLLGIAPSPEARAGSNTRWTWSCEKCSDPACEHRLFQDLLQGRRGNEG